MSSTIGTQNQMTKQQSLPASSRPSENASARQQSLRERPSAASKTLNETMSETMGPGADFASVYGQYVIGSVGKNSIGTNLPASRQASMTRQPSLPKYAPLPSDISNKSVIPPGTPPSGSWTLPRPAPLKLHQILANEPNSGTSTALPAGCSPVSSARSSICSNSNSSDSLNEISPLGQTVGYCLNPGLNQDFPLIFPPGSLPGSPIWNKQSLESRSPININGARRIFNAQKSPVWIDGQRKGNLMSKTKRNANEILKMDSWSSDDAGEPLRFPTNPPPSPCEGAVARGPGSAPGSPVAAEGVGALMEGTQTEKTSEEEQKECWNITASQVYSDPKMPQRLAAKNLPIGSVGTPKRTSAKTMPIGSSGTPKRQSGKSIPVTKNASNRSNVSKVLSNNTATTAGPCPYAGDYSESMGQSTSDYSSIGSPVAGAAVVPTSPIEEEGAQSPMSDGIAKQSSFRINGERGIFNGDTRSRRLSVSSCGSNDSCLSRRPPNPPPSPAASSVAFDDEVKILGSEELVVSGLNKLNNDLNENLGDDFNPMDVDALNMDALTHNTDNRSHMMTSSAMANRTADLNSGPNGTNTLRNRSKFSMSTISAGNSMSFTGSEMAHSSELTPSSDYEDDCEEPEEEGKILSSENNTHGDKENSGDGDKDSGDEYFNINGGHIDKKKRENANDENLNDEDVKNLKMETNFQSKLSAPRGKDATETVTEKQGKQTESCQNRDPKSMQKQNLARTLWLSVALLIFLIPLLYPGSSFVWSVKYSGGKTQSRVVETVETGLETALTESGSENEAQEGKAFLSDEEENEAQESKTDKRAFLAGL